MPHRRFSATRGPSGRTFLAKRLGPPTWHIISSFGRDSISPRMRSPVADLLADAAAALAAADVRWYLFGAQAAILHGAARLTADVDITVRLPPSTSGPRLVEIARRHGFTP